MPPMMQIAEKKYRERLSKRFSRNSGMVKIRDLMYSGSRNVAKRTMTTTPVKL